MSLYLKYRPRSLERVKGNEQIIKTLNGLLDKESPPHVFLLHGPTGCGKTTIARIIAKRLGCVGSDYKEVDTADFRGIDSVREIRKNSMFKPMEGNVRVWVLDEIHKMTGDAQNALLKILEDTPSHVFFILCTTQPEKLLSTIKGRCSKLQVKSLTEVQMSSLLKRVVKREGQELEENIYDQIIQNAEGHPRDALQVLEQVLSVDPEGRLEVAKKTEEQINQSIELCRALIKGAQWKEVRTILGGLQGQEAESIRRVVLGYCQAVLLKTDKPICGLILEEFIEPFYNSGFPQLVYACYSIIKN